MNLLQISKKSIFYLLITTIMMMALTLSSTLARDNRLGIIDAPLSAEHERSGTLNDAYDNLIRDEEGFNYNYLALPDGFARLKLDEDHARVATERLSFNPYKESERSQAPIPEEVLQEQNLGEAEYLAQKWKTGIWGTGIGASGFSAFDIDNDGKSEILAGGGYGFGNNRFWYILSYSSQVGKYQQDWLSEEYASTISRIIAADVSNRGQITIYVALSNGTIRVYDATTHDLLHSFSSSLSGIADMTIADVDNDSQKEIVISSSAGIAVYDAQTYASEWQTASYGSNQVEVANVDGDTAPEIVTTNRVIDGISHALEWSHSAGFGALIQLADIDNDQMAEIIAAEAWYQINAFDADTQSPKWDMAVDLDIDALLVTDFDNDGVQEIVYGDGQWGAVYAIDSTTLVQEWQINNPEHGVTGIAFGDVDNDESIEVLWGAGWSSTGSDNLFIGDTATYNIEWQSQDIGGPLSALDVGDVDNDGRDEIVMVSFESDSGYDDGIIFIYDAITYDLEWQSAPLLNGRAWTGVHALELADVDHDGVLEILVATADIYDGIIMAYDGISHNLDWQTVDHSGTYFSALAVADIDNDQQVEVIGGQDRQHTGASGVYVRIFDGSTGVEEWRTTNLTNWGGIVDIDTGDIDHDGQTELLFSVSDGNAYVYDGVTQSQEWQSSFNNPRAVRVMDVDQDGETEILIGRSNGQLYAFDGQTYQQEWSESLSSQSINSLRLADTNRDRNAELFLTDNNYLYIVDAATREPIWQSQDLGNTIGQGGHLVINDINQDTRDEVVVGGNYAMYVFSYDLLPYDPYLTVSQSFARPNDVLDYTIELVSFSENTLPMIVTDTLPANTRYLTDTLAASSGEWSLTDNTIHWTANLSIAQPISLTFALIVEAATSDREQITNTTVYSAGTFMDVRTVSTIIDALPPVSTIDQPITDELITGDVYTITGTATDLTSGVDKIELSINGGDWQEAIGTTSWHYNWTLPITDSQVTIQARSVDNVGHSEMGGPTSVVLVDNLSPYLLSTTPAHGQSNILTTEPIVATFSEPILVETLAFSCQPDPGDWSVDTSLDGSTVILSHAPFNSDQIYSCHISQVLDQAGHSLIAGAVPNLWGFATMQEVSPLSDITISGATIGIVNSSYTFIASVDPFTATTPITYTWQATDLSSITHTGDIADSVVLTWSLSGTKLITVTAFNAGAIVSDTYSVTIEPLPETATLTPTSTQTATLTPTSTQTAALTPTSTQTVTLTPTSTQTAALTPTSTQTVTLTPASTQTATLTPTSTQTATLTPTSTQTVTLTPTATQINNPTSYNYSIFIPLISR